LFGEYEDTESQKIALAGSEIELRNSRSRIGEFEELPGILV
jgi:hypothetical protein